MNNDIHYIVTKDNPSQSIKSSKRIRHKLEVSTTVITRNWSLIGLISMDKRVRTMNLKSQTRLHARHHSTSWNRLQKRTIKHCWTWTPLSSERKTNHNINSPSKLANSMISANVSKTTSPTSLSQKSMGISKLSKSSTRMTVLKSSVLKCLKKNIKSSSFKAIIWLTKSKEH